MEYILVRVALIRFTPVILFFTFKTSLDCGYLVNKMHVFYAKKEHMLCNHLTYLGYKNAVAQYSHFEMILKIWHVLFSCHNSNVI